MDVSFHCERKMSYLQDMSGTLLRKIVRVSHGSYCYTPSPSVCHSLSGPQALEAGSVPAWLGARWKQMNIWDSESDDFLLRNSIITHRVMQYAVTTNSSQLEKSSSGWIGHGTSCHDDHGRLLGGQGRQAAREIIRALAGPGAWQCNNL